ncbi:hypothetical protein D3C78_1822750 [compost metagenome]
MLTDLGAELIINIQTSIRELREEVENVIGKGKVETFLEIATEINDYFEKDRSERGDFKIVG